MIFKSQEQFSKLVQNCLATRDKNLDTTHTQQLVNCFEKATTIEVTAGNHKTISLSLCNICVNNFVGDD